MQWTINPCKTPEGRPTGHVLPNAETAGCISSYLTCLNDISWMGTLAGCMSSSLTLPKWYLATFKNMEWLYKNRSPTKNIWKEKNLQTCFCCLYEKLTTVQIWGQTNKFPLTCSFQKGPKRWFGHSHLEVMKNSTIISFSLKILDI